MDLINTIRLLTCRVLPTDSNVDDVMRLSNILNDVKTQELKRLMKSELQREMRDTNSLGVIDPLLRDVKYDTIIKNKGNTLKKSCDTKLITISLDDDKFNPSKIVESMCSLLKKSLFKDCKYKWVIEQRADNYNYHGYHIHLLCRNFSVSKSRIIDKVYESMKSFLSGKNYIDVRLIVNDNGVEDYISGDKQSPEKMRKIPFDESMRKKYKFKDIYTNSEAS